MIVLFGIGLVPLVTTFGLCNLSFCDGSCFEVDVTVLELLLVVEEGPKSESKESFRFCRAGG